MKLLMRADPDLMAAIPVVQVETDIVVVAAAATDAAHVTAVVPSYPDDQVLSVNDVLVKFEVVAFMRTKLAAAVVAKVPAARTDDELVVRDVAVAE
jgi:hypothetical protein